MYHSPSKQVSGVTLLVHVHNPQPVSWIEHTIGNIWIRSSIDGQFFLNQKHYVCLSGAIWGSRHWQEKPEIKPCKELTTSCMLLSSPVTLARCWTVEVFPVPVSPTRRTGSPLVTHTDSCSSRTAEGRVAANVWLSLFISIKKKKRK